MAETLKIKSIIDDNKKIIEFNQNELTTNARHGQLNVVNGILYTYYDIDNSNKGKWIPLSNKMNIYRYETTEPITDWKFLPDDFSNDIIVVAYEKNDKLCQQNYVVDINNKDFTVNIHFESPFDGYVYVYIHNSLKETLINFYYIVDETLGNSYYEKLNDINIPDFNEFLNFDEYFGHNVLDQDGTDHDSEFEQLNDKLGAIVASRIKK